jgi:phospholipid-binding lipoprotein MlaA
MSRSPSLRTRGAFAMAALLALALAGCASRGPRADAPAQDNGTLVATPPSDATASDATTPAASADVATTDATTAPMPPDAAADTTAAADVANATAASGTDARTQAEQDYDAIYGSSPYDPVADPTLPTPAEMPVSYDPWEKFNRRMHRFNNAVDRTVAKPLAKAYVAVVPRPMRLGVTNFFNNLGQPLSAINALLQGKPGQAGQSLGRFLVNTTIGVAGLFDPATRFRIPNRSEDFGQTLGIWGWRKSRYVELPLFGPRTVRDTFGLVGDAPLSPIRHVEEDKVRYFLQGLQLVDTRVQLLPLDSLREGATDEYALFRDGWTQRRNYQIFGERRREGDDQLPDYLLEEEANPTVPVDAMPIVPGSPAP